MTDVPPSYKNPQLSSFEEQKYVYSELLQQYAANDEYLLQLCRKIEYLTPPACRKHFILKDSFYEDESYGCVVSGENVIFDDSKEKRIYVDFTDNNLIDNNRTTAFIDQRVQTDGQGNKKVIKQCTVPLTQTETIDSTTRDYSPWTIRDETTGEVLSDDMTCNEFWYIGFDRNRHYETRPNWLQNMLNGEIPGISRAQTFKPKVAGLLESVVLNLKGTNNTGMPLIVEIRKTELINGVRTPVPSGKEGKLAYKEIKFENTDPGVYSIVFDNPPVMDPAETYAIVLLSPLSHHTNCYWIGGWNMHCHADVYEDGNAFYSYNSGYNWIRYGKDEEVDYHWGQYAPQDFAFQCHIKQTESTYIKNQNYYLYLKPILANPITQIEINADDNIADSGTSITYQASINGNNWTTFDESKIITLDTPRNVIYVRAVLKTTNQAYTPRINNLQVTLTMNAPTEMYARTRTYYPKVEGVLSADVWGRIFAPFETDPTVTCTAEIISEKLVYENFTIIEPDDLTQYTWIEDLDKDAIEASSNLTQYITDNPSVVKILGEHQVYVLGFIDKLKFVTSPAYPIRECNLTPATAGVANVPYSEWYQFIVDYDNDTLQFRSNYLANLVKGTLTVAYNPIFIQGLTAEEVGYSNPNKTTTDGDVNDEGLILDYFKETFLINDDHLETRRVPLRTVPLDPIRHLYLNGKELKQDRDYTIDFNSKEIVFPVVNTDEESSILNLNDKLEIIYTPNIDDNGISIGWYAKRTNLLKQVKILPYYIEYKA